MNAIKTPIYKGAKAGAKEFNREIAFWGWKCEGCGACYRYKDDADGCCEGERDGWWRRLSKERKEQNE